MYTLQHTIPQYTMPIDSVGISSYKRRISYIGDTPQESIGICSFASNLPATLRGTKLTTLVELLEAENISIYNTWSLLPLLYTTQDILKVDSISLSIQTDLAFPIHSPRTHKLAHNVYNVIFKAILNGNLFCPLLVIEIPYFTVCPCSLGSSIIGAHTQRVYMTLSLNSDATLSIEKIIEITKNIASAPIYPLLKTLDEKAIIDEAFSNPLFIEDVTRSVASSLQSYQEIQGFLVEIVSLESLHGHNISSVLEHNHTHQHVLDRSSKE